ncbi:MAG: hypothetical protein N2554_03405, partial [Fimbriimonadales bacterium]|nr:hypothetical protein [Fimbriimonadales bacterium]
MPKTLNARTKRTTRPQKRAERTPTPEQAREVLPRLQSLELPVGDGDRMESDWHVVHISLIDELVRLHLGASSDYFCGGNMFLSFSLEQAQEI